MKYPIWPILIVLTANIGYNIITKQTPPEANAFASLTVTYLVSAALAGILFLCTKEGSIGQEVSKLNYTAPLLAVSVVMLEFGYIFVYRNGWSVNLAPLVANTLLAVALLWVGKQLYYEALTLRQLGGMALSIAGLFLMLRR